MLQPLKPDLEADEIGRASFTPASPSDLLTTLAGLLRRQYPLIILIFLLSASVAAVYLATTPAIFLAKASMIIDSRKVQVFQQQSILGDVAIDAAQIESQVEILKSENIALSVIKELKLAEDPEFTGPGFGLLGKITTLIAQYADPVPEPRSEPQLERKAVGEFARRIGVRRVGTTYIMEISFRSVDASKAASIANAIADAYVLDQLEAKYQATRRASSWLQDRIRELRTQASAAEKAVLDFKARNNIVDLGGRLVGEQQLAEINSQLVSARAATAEARARLERIQEVQKQDVPDASVTDVLKNDVITKFRQQYLDLGTKEATWSVRYGPGHLAAVNLRTQMAEIRRAITNELNRIAETYKSELEIARAREESIESSFSSTVAQGQSTGQSQVALRELESNSQTYRTLYDNFLQRYMESVQQQSFPITEARVISAASPPSSKTEPNSLIVLSLALGFAAAVGAGTAWMRDIWDRVFRSSEQVEMLLNQHCMAILPVVEAATTRAVAKTKRGNVSLVSTSATPVQRTIENLPAVLKFVVDNPFARFSESIRHVKVSVDLGGVVRANKVIGITSTLPNEGKSTISANFAFLMAHAGAKVLLIDGDLRNPSLSRQVAPNAEAGLMEVVSGKRHADDLIWIDPVTNLHFMPTVVTTTFAHTSELLASAAMKKTIDELRSRYDYVVVDLSPLAPVVDVRATTHFVDSYIYVVEWGKTPVATVKHAMADASSVLDRVLGVILNKADMKILGRYEGYKGSYYYSRYYSRYGYGYGKN